MESVGEELYLTKHSAKEIEKLREKIEDKKAVIAFLRAKNGEMIERHAAEVKEYKAFADRCSDTANKAHQATVEARKISERLAGEMEIFEKKMPQPSSLDDFAQWITLEKRCAVLEHKYETTLDRLKNLQKDREMDERYFSEPKVIYFANVRLVKENNALKAQLAKCCCGSGSKA